MSFKDALDDLNLAIDETFFEDEATHVESATVFSGTLSQAFDEHGQVITRGAVWHCLSTAVPATLRIRDRLTVDGLSFRILDVQHVRGIATLPLERNG